MRWALSLVVATLLLGVVAARAGTLVVGPLYKPPAEIGESVLKITLPSPSAWFVDTSGCSPYRQMFLQVSANVAFEIGAELADYELYDLMARELTFCTFLTQRN